MAALDQKTVLGALGVVLLALGTSSLRDMQADIKSTAQAVPQIQQDVALIKLQQKHDRETNAQGFRALKNEWDLYKQMVGYPDDSGQAVAELHRIKGVNNG